MATTTARSSFGKRREGGAAAPEGIEIEGALGGWYDAKIIRIQTTSRQWMVLAICGAAFLAVGVWLVLSDFGLPARNVLDVVERQVVILLSFAIAGATLIVFGMRSRITFAVEFSADGMRWADPFAAAFALLRRKTPGRFKPFAGFDRATPTPAGGGIALGAVLRRRMIRLHTGQRGNPSLQYVSLPPTSQMQGGMSIE